MSNHGEIKASESVMKTLKKGNFVREKDTGNIGVLNDIQEPHDRFHLLNVSGWQYGIARLEKLDSAAVLKVIREQGAEIERLREVLGQIARVRRAENGESVLGFITRMNAIIDAANIALYKEDAQQTKGMKFVAKDDFEAEPHSWTKGQEYHYYEEGEAFKLESNEGRVTGPRSVKPLILPRFDLKGDTNNEN